ncbi:MAG: hypothetical protein KatS3mg001_132 [Candidatus Pacearchaeota archaeon]|nr:MAG: hypothetical protein KatS3mg001_132 [Candidatus Pacearchaeota archaeon]
MEDRRINKAHHRLIRKHAPKSIKKIKRFFYFKYYKFIFFLFLVLLAYYIFSLNFTKSFIENLEEFSYIGSFIAGFFMAYGFSAPFGIAYFLILESKNLIFHAILGGIGAAFGDFVIFKFIKLSLKKEFYELKKVSIIKGIENAIKNNKNILIRHYLIYVFAGIIIALPVFPDEFGVSMLAGLTTVKIKKLLIIAFILHSLAIFLILYFGFVF